VNEAELVRRARAGDAASLTALLDRERAGLEHFVAARIPRPLARKVGTDDVVQETFITAHARLGDFEHRGEGAFRAWLLRIAELKLREAVRRFAGTAKRGAARELSRGARRDTCHFAAKEATPSEHAMAGELASQADAALERLPEDYRRILTLVRKENQSLRDAADVLGRGYEATKKLYGRAVAALARELRADLGSES